ncbi:hypothetical protein PUN28_009386 [Cardiocondyla obscurior]|uniref:Uncharacterized protein n=1 Tax=Cardiocondyla obscurior TaxID=286306 RepID=A0AAW2FVA0_9HYME
MKLSDNNSRVVNSPGRSFRECSAQKDYSHILRGGGGSGRASCLGGAAPSSTSAVFPAGLALLRASANKRQLRNIANCQKKCDIKRIVGAEMRERKGRRNSWPEINSNVRESFTLNSL